MHRVIRNHLEEFLGASHLRECDPQVAAHLKDCEECRTQLESMREQAHLLRQLRTDAEPRPGFYARVMERIERQGPLSIWSVFSESPFGRRIAAASVALALLAALVLYTSGPAADAGAEPAGTPTVQFMAGQLPGGGVPDRDAVLVNLVTYQEQ